MPGGCKACHPPTDAAPSEAEVKRQAGQVRVHLSVQVLATARRAHLAPDFDLAVDREVFLPLPAAVATLLLQCRVGADVYPVPLIVEVGSLVDEREVGDREGLPLP